MEYFLRLIILVMGFWGLTKILRTADITWKHDFRAPGKLVLLVSIVSIWLIFVFALMVQLEQVFKT